MKNFNEICNNSNIVLMSQHATRNQDFKTIEILSLNDTQNHEALEVQTKSNDWNKPLIDHCKPILAIIHMDEIEGKWNKKTLNCPK